MSIKNIEVYKARVHNLKNVSVNIPKNKITVITGPSGSGKSSLAFDTIYAEGQRRYIESLSSYARQFLGQSQAPDVESITGLSPSIAIDQKTTTKNPRSTVGTVTEIYDYLRVLYARVGNIYCTETQEELKNYTPSQLLKFIEEQKLKAKIYICAPLLFNNQKELQTEITKFISMGYVRAILDNEVLELESLNVKNIDHNSKVCIVIDRLINKKGNEKRVVDAIELSYKLSSGKTYILVNDKGTFFSQKYLLKESNKEFPTPEPRLFSFNSPLGACEKCNGIGETKLFDEDLIIFDKNLPILKGAIIPLQKKNNFLYRMVIDMADQEGVDIDIPFAKLSKSFRKKLFYGSNKEYRYKFKSENSNFEFTKSFPGIINWLQKKYLEATTDKKRAELETMMMIKHCDLCDGNRLNQFALNVKINDTHIMEICNKNIAQAYDFVQNIKLSGEKAIIADKLLREITNRFKFLNEVGLEYLTLNRSAATLSGGESQRIRLATQIGSALSGVLYVLDEPSIGLHQRDNIRLINTIKGLRDLGNTVLVVEHDEDTMKASDHIIDIGPGAGIHGGEIVAEGNYEAICSHKDSITGMYLSGERKIEVPKVLKSPTQFIELMGGKKNNINNLDIKIPLGCITCISGVSGSGKSTLVHSILVPALKSYIAKDTPVHAPYKSIKGAGNIDQVIELDQSPIGRTPHSNPATYTNIFDTIRKLFASTAESQVRGYKPGRFSFNVKGGRCEECEGNGVKKIEMHFLPDVYVKCDECNGSRYNRETLSILYRGKHIADILEMSISEAKDFFKNHKKLNRTLKLLDDIGLGYMKLGQPATTLSGGEAQRLKLSRELSKATKNHCFYVLDEPTTGLHFKDIEVLLLSIKKLIDQGHSVVVIEHNLDVLKSADYIIDLGPEGGNKGGKLVFEGTPKELSKIKSSHTGKFLKPYFKI